MDEIKIDDIRVSKKSALILFIGISIVISIAGFMESIAMGIVTTVTVVSFCASVLVD